MQPTSVLFFALCASLCLLQMGQAGRPTSAPPRTFDLESLEFEEGQVEVFQPSPDAPHTVCMPKERYDNTQRLLNRVKQYMKSVQSYMDTCMALSNSIRERTAASDD